MALHLFLVGVASFVWVGLRNLQTLHAVSKRFAWMVPTSILIELAGVYYVVTVAAMGHFWWLFLVTGFGAGTGTVFVTWLHHRGRK